MSRQANPLGLQDVVGNLVLSASTDLNIPIGTTISNSASVTSANITCPAVPVKTIFLVQISCGDATLIADTGTGTPSFVSANKYTATNTNGSLLALPVNTDATNVNVALKITNTSGVTLTVTSLRLLVLSAFNPLATDWHTVKGGALAGVVLGHQGSSTGVFPLNT